MTPEIAGEPVLEGPRQSDHGEEGGVDGGVPGGTTGGSVGGWVDGVLNGSLDGAPFGVLHGLPKQQGPIYLDGGVRPPERITFVKPEYPEVARKSRVEGKVILELVVGRTGDVEEVKVLRSDPLFDQAAVDAVVRWKYRPALQGGRAVKVYLTVVVEFDLR